MTRTHNGTHAPPWTDKGGRTPHICRFTNLAVGIALVVAACSGGDVETHAATTPSTQPQITQPPTTESPTTTTVPELTPVEIGRQFVVARNAHDSDTAMSLFASDAVIHFDDHMTAVEQYDAHFAWHAATDWMFEVQECLQTQPPPRAAVTCTYEMTNAWSGPLGIAPTIGSFDFVIEDDLIEEITHNINRGGFNDGWSKFQNWVVLNHPEDRVLMYNSPIGSAANWAPESIALWDTYTDLFVASIEPD
jgi:hypothetical protein